MPREHAGVTVYLEFCVYLTECFMWLSFLYQLTTVSLCVLSEFIVACVVYSTIWLPYGVINDDNKVNFVVPPPP